MKIVMCEHMYKVSGVVSERVSTCRANQAVVMITEQIPAIETSQNGTGKTFSGEKMNSGGA